MKFIKILARPLWLDFEGALKKNLILEKLFSSSIHTLKMMCFPFLTLFFAIFREFLYEVFFFNAPLTHGRAKSHFIDKHVVLYYESNLLHLLKKGKHNRGKTREIFFYFFLKLHIFRLSGGVSCWHLPYQKSMCPSRICSFRRSLPQLGTACNLRFKRTFQG